MAKFFTALAAAGAVLLGSLWAVVEVWGDDLLASYIEPPEPFDSHQLPSAPDYNDPAYWAAFPGRPSAARLTPDGLQSAEYAAPADVFYIHPTSYIAADSWNSPLFTDSRAWEMVDIILGAQASAFNLCCEVYAPHYRQAALSSFLDFDGDSGRRALELAYRDIADAFAAFLHYNNGRPFLIASHSQGTYHALRLLAEHVDGRAIQKRMVAAYVVGYWVPMDTFGRTLQHIAPCESAGDTGCLLHWSTYGDRGVRRAGVPHWYPGGPELSDGKPLLCNNPLNWQHNGPRAEASEHPGALYVARGGSLYHDLLNIPAEVKLTSLPQPLEHWTWAECRDGLLHVAPQDSGPFAELGDDPNQDYHLIDYSLFYEAVRENAWKRVRRFGDSLASSR
ncbi:DUF3089 domain-containing protein [Parahaliea aestuarii]|uniref:DUF3089 domain-containing protein n=1 Tax=Parahaliea aestuarii TaxID=1852021 RepID=A0A5C9A014_9GAMM|nr:DUF3089 domain-containing protein [Parahaliea aestuarii]TXS93120.1 DUF3089 domain-containing protein [Parahaliea aestuarii]